MRFSQLALYFHTIRHLKTTQVVGRLRTVLPKPRPRSLTGLPRRQFAAAFVAPVAAAPSMLGPTRFCFLNTQAMCADGDGWQSASVSRLWLYNLHYFDYLNAPGPAQQVGWQRELLLRWVVENPVGSGAGWEPYPTSRRLVNWVKWAAAGQGLPRECEESLAAQARLLRVTLEYHLLGNHLLANAKALIFAGLHFTGAEAQSWVREGMRLLDRQLLEQVLPDGGHFELSPMYHATVLEDLLDVLNVCAATRWPIPDSLHRAVQSMRRWLSVMVHPDGDIAFFNDAAFAIAPTVAELEAYATRLRLPPFEPDDRALAVLESSGYLRVRLGPATLFCDCAMVGPDHQPGHAHADTLSFELSLFGQRVFVNSGTSRYGVDAQRQSERGTAAHNTVTVDGEDSSEVWAGFRVARRAKPVLESATLAGDRIAISARHDGYRRLPGRNLHTRTWLLQDRSLSIQDRISGRFARAEAHYHFHPAVGVESAGVDSVRLNLPTGQTSMLQFQGASRLEVGTGTWHPQFGVSVANRHVRASFAGDTLELRVEWPVNE